MSSFRKNHFNPDAACDGCLFDIKGDEFLYVSHLKMQGVEIYTLVSDSGKDKIIPGMHKVNRLGYLCAEYICEILQGPSGCGKSTYANSQEDAVICSADNYFMHNGEYIFTPENLSIAHETCMKDFIYYISQKRRHIIVDNTNIRVWEWCFYYKYAELHNYKVKIKRFLTSPAECIKRGAKAPPELVYNMAKNLEAIPPMFTVEYA